MKTKVFLGMFAMLVLIVWSCRKDLGLVNNPEGESVDFWVYNTKQYNAGASIANERGIRLLPIAIDDLKSMRSTRKFQKFVLDYGKPDWDYHMEFKDAQGAHVLVVPIGNDRKESVPAVLVVSYVGDYFKYNVVLRGKYPKATGKNLGRRLLPANAWTGLFAAFDKELYDKGNSKGFTRKAGKAAGGTSVSSWISVWYWECWWECEDDGYGQCLSGTFAWTSCNYLYGWSWVSWDGQPGGEEGGGGNGQSGGGGSASYGDQVLNGLTSLLGLNSTQAAWLSQHTHRKNQLYSYLDALSFSTDELPVALAHLNLMISDNVYFGMMDYRSPNGSGRMWWTDITWLSANDYENLNMFQDAGYPMKIGVAVDLGIKPLHEYSGGDKCTGLAHMWNNYTQNEVMGFLTEDNQLLVTQVMPISGGRVNGLNKYEGKAYYGWPDSEGAPAQTYAGMIHHPGKAYYVPVKAAVHTHTPCRTDNTNGVSDLDVSLEDKKFANLYSSYFSNFWVIGCGQIGRHSTGDNFFGTHSGSISATCQYIIP